MHNTLTMYFLNKKVVRKSADITIPEYVLYIKCLV